MNDNSLVSSFRDSILGDTINVASDLAEVGFDLIAKEGIGRDIPFISTVMGICKIGNSLEEMHYTVKLKIFLDNLKLGICDSNMKNLIESKMLDEKRRKKELEYLLLILNRFVELNKPEMLAKIYLAYLNEIITWEELAVCSEIINRFLPGDYELLKTDAIIKVRNDVGTENALRLVALGLAVDKSLSPMTRDQINSLFTMLDNPSVTEHSSDDNDDCSKYERTNLGNKLVSIIG